MIYPGNPSLSPEVQERALQTFKQSLDLVAQGRDQEALAGCEFILGLDALFRPARLLQERVKSPVRPVVINDLRAKIEEAPPAATAPPPASAAAPPPASAAPPLPPADGPPLATEAPLPVDDSAAFGELGELQPLEGADLGALEIEEVELPSASPPPPPSAPPLPTAPPPPPPPSAAPPAAAPPQSGLGAVLYDLLEKENYQQVLQIAGTQKEAIEQDPQLGTMVEKARAALAADSASAVELPELEAIPVEPASEPEVVSPPPVAPVDEPMLSFDEEPEPLSLAADEESEPPADDDDLLALQAQSLSIDAEEEEAGDELGGLDLGAGLDDDLDLDSVDLDEDELPDLDVGAPLGAASDEPEVSVADELAGDEFDLAAGAVEPDEEGRGRITELLAEGQEIFEGGDYQGAIDVWSRIFLIDVTHGEASQRIEEARRKKAELERQAEEIFHQGVDHIEQQNLGQAKESFAQVLEIDPEHSLAREYLEQLEAGEVPVIKKRSEVAEDEDFESSVEDYGEGEEADQSMDAAVQRDRVVVVKKTDKRLVALGAIVALAVIGGASYLFLNKDKLFPNAETVAPSVPRIDPTARATALYERGDVEEAIAALRQVETEDPSYDKALALISKWEAELEAEDEIDTGPSPELLARRNRILAAARQAHETDQCIRAGRFFESANKILPLDEADRAIESECSLKLEDFSEELRLFGEREYAAILPGLWLKREEDPADPDLQLLIIDSYYNLALADLQRGDPTAAASKLSEALTVEPENRDLARLHLFAETYSGRSRDVLYQIFVKYLPSR